MAPSSYLQNFSMVCFDILYSYLYPDSNGSYFIINPDGVTTGTKFVNTRDPATFLDNL